MLKIHPEQMTLKIAKESGFVDWYSNDVMAQHLPGFHAAFAPEIRHEMVKNGRHQALKHGFKDPVSEAHWNHAVQHTDNRHWYSEAAP